MSTPTPSTPRPTSSATASAPDSLLGDQAETLLGRCPVRRDGSAGRDAGRGPDGAGLDLTRPALISWLGVIMYLDREAVDPLLWDRTDALRPPALSWLVHAHRAG